MLGPVYLLETDADGALRPQRAPRGGWWPTVVVPRVVCVFEAVPCRGLAWRERRSFAAIQARRLAPFAASGVNACVRADTLMLWFWDQAEVRAAVANLELDDHRTRVWAEPLLQPPPRGTGSAPQRCAGGVDERTLSDGAITASRWVADAAGGAELVVPRRFPWAWELTGQRLGDAPAAAAATQQWARLGQAAAFAGAAGSVAFAAYWGTQLTTARSRLEAFEAAGAQSSQRLGNLADLRSQAGAAAEWVRSYARLARGLQLPAFIAALAPVLESSGVVIKELEIHDEEVRLGVVSAGAEIDTPRLLQSLAAMPGVSRVQLRTGLDFSQAGFTLRAPGYMEAPGLPPATPLP